MRLEHCQKCKKQIEYRIPGADRVSNDKKSKMNQLKTRRRSVTAFVYTRYYCNECWSEMERLLISKAFLPSGGFESDE